MNMNDTNLEHETDTNEGPMDRAKVEREIKKFGGAYGKGQNSRPAMGLLLVDAANRLKDVGPDDANDLVTMFSKEAAKSQGIEYSAVASHKVQVSKAKRFLMLGALPAIDGVEIMDRACEAIVKASRMADNPLKGSAYDNMVLIARRQIEQPTVALTNDEISKILTEVKPDKTALDMVIQAYKNAYRLVEKLADEGVDPALLTNAEQATLEYAEQIKALDGELPAMTKEDRVIAKADAIKAKRSGFISTQTIVGTTLAPVALVSVPEHGAESAAA